jgi:hypothetical protein
MRKLSVVMILALGLSAGACGGDKATCKKIIKKALTCELGDKPGSAEQVATELGDTMIEQACSDDDAASKVAKASSCLDQSDCKAYQACLDKAAPDSLK